MRSHTQFLHSFHKFFSLLNFFEKKGTFISRPLTSSPQNHSPTSNPMFFSSPCSLTGIIPFRSDTCIYKHSTLIILVWMNFNKSKAGATKKCIKKKKNNVQKNTKSRAQTNKEANKNNFYTYLFSYPKYKHTYTHIGSIFNIKSHKKAVKVRLKERL